MTRSSPGAVKLGIDIIDKDHETCKKLLVLPLDSPLTGTYTLVLVKANGLLTHFGNLKWTHPYDTARKQVFFLPFPLS